MVAIELSSFCLSSCPHSSFSISMSMGSLILATRSQEAIVQRLLGGPEMNPPHFQPPLLRHELVYILGRQHATTNGPYSQCSECSVEYANANTNECKRQIIHPSGGSSTVGGNRCANHTMRRNSRDEGVCQAFRPEIPTAGGSPGTVGGNTGPPFFVFTLSDIKSHLTT